MARKTLTELLNEINNEIQENTSGDITATVLNDLLQSLTNGLYLSQIIANSEEVDAFQFDGFTIDVTNRVITVTGPTVVPTSFGAIHITTDETNTITFSAGQTTTDDTLLPITFGTTYFKIPGWSEDALSDGISYNDTVGGLEVSLQGVYRFSGWLSCRHTSNNSTIGIVFGIFRGGSLLGTSPRPTPTEVPNADDLGQTSGEGLVELQVGDVVVPLIATQNTGTVTVNNATLIGQLVKETS